MDEGEVERLTGRIDNVVGGERVGDVDEKINSTLRGGVRRGMIGLKQV